MVGSMQSRAYGAAYGASNTDIRGWVVVKGGQIVAVYGDDSAGAKAYAKDVGGYAANKTGAGIPFGVEGGAVGVVNALTSSVSAVTNILAPKAPAAAPMAVAAPKAKKSNTAMYVVGGVVVLALVGGGLFLALRRK